MVLVDGCFVSGVLVHWRQLLCLAYILCVPGLIEHSVVT